MAARQALEAGQTLWRVRAADGREYQGRILVGVDGAYSFVRRAALGQKADPEHIYLAVQDSWRLLDSGQVKAE